MLFRSKFYLFILFMAVLGLRFCARAFSSCGERRATLRCGVGASHCGVYSCCRAQALGTQPSVVVARGLSSCGSRALERRLSSCGVWAELLRGMGDLPGAGLKPVSPALAGRFLTTVPRGKPRGPALTPGRGTKILHAMQRSPKKKKKTHTHA